VDPFLRYPEEDRLQQFLDGLRPVFIVPVASTLPATTNDAIEKAKSIEAALSGSAPLSAYSSLYSNTSNDRVLDQLERLTTKLSNMERQLNNQPRRPYTSFSNQSNNYRQPNRSNFSSNNGPSRSNNFSGNNQNVDTRSCYICQRTGHIARNCPQNAPRTTNYNNNSNNNNSSSNNSQNRSSQRPQQNNQSAVQLLAQALTEALQQNAQSSSNNSQSLNF
jgi:hypothetical protein